MQSIWLHLGSSASTDRPYVWGSVQTASAIFKTDTCTLITGSMAFASTILSVLGTLYCKVWEHNEQKGCTQSCTFVEHYGTVLCMLTRIDIS